MNILFLGYIGNPNSLSDYSGISIAGQNYQVNFLESLYDLNEFDNIEAISIPPLSSFPNEKRILIKSQAFSIKDKIGIIEIGFINIPVIKQLNQVINAFLLTKSYLKNNPNCIVIQFNVFPQTGLPLYFISKMFKNKVITILADLPINDNPNLNLLSSLLRHIFDFLTLKFIQYFKNFIVLNNNVINKYTSNKNNLLIPGGVNNSSRIYPITKSNKKNIIYTGALTEYSGVINFIKSYNFLKSKNIYFEIYGNGYLSDSIRKIIENNPNISFGGQLSHDEILNLQNNAWLLINPRPTDDPISQFTFPSKIFEYLLSGTPILTTKLNGFDDNLLENVFYIENNSPEEIARKIDELSNTDERILYEMAKKAQDFVNTKYKWTNLSKLVSEFIKEARN